MPGPRLRLVLGASLATAGCASGGPPGGRWVGPVKPEPPNPVCTESRGVLQIARGQLIFTPTEGTWVLAGTASLDGKLEASKTTVGADKKPYVTHFQGALANDAVQGTYTTPRCTFTVNLTRR